MTTEVAVKPPQLTEEQWLDQLVSMYLAKHNAKLTPAEMRELRFIAQGHTAAKDAAAMTGISDQTVRGRRKKLYRKLDVTGVNAIVQDLLAIGLNLLASRGQIERG